MNKRKAAIPIQRLKKRITVKSRKLVWNPSRFLQHIQRPRSVSKIAAATAGIWSEAVIQAKVVATDVWIRRFGWLFLVIVFLLYTYSTREACVHGLKYLLDKVFQVVVSGIPIWFPAKESLENTYFACLKLAFFF